MALNNDWKRVDDMLRRVTGEEKGAVMVIVALLLVVLLGFTGLVIDVGWATVERRNMVTAADAGALAGAADLCVGPAEAVQKAEEYAIQHNGADRAQIVVSDYEKEGDKRLITVVTEKDVDYKFARVLGFDGVTVKAQAKAIIGPIEKVSGMVGDVVPLGLPEVTLRNAEVGQTLIIKSSHWQHIDFNSPGMFGALALDGRGASNWEDDFKYGYKGEIRVEDLIDTEVDTEPGNMSGPTKRAVEYRLANGLDEIVVLVVGETQKPGRSKVKVLGFAPMKLLGVRGQGNESIVEAILLEKTIVPGPVGDGESFGMYAVQLVK